jgi:predicted DNA-binding protein YlxM (UPF0122 family)
MIDYWKNKCICGKKMYRYSIMCKECFNKTLKSEGNPNYKNLFTKEHLIKEYITNKKSITQIAIENKCQRQTVRRYLKKYNIIVDIYRNRKGMSNGMFGKHHTEKSKEAIRKCHLGTKMLLKTKKLLSKMRKGISTANRLCRHHIDLNKYNNKKRNILILSGKYHTKIHIRAYHYLVEKGMIKEYIKWFKKNYLPN